MNTLIKKWKALPGETRRLVAVVAVLSAGAILFAAGYGVGYLLGAIT